MDYDLLLSDDLIGETTIDLERRYFDDKWASMPEYPIETRTLRKPGADAATGFIRLWVEVFDPAHERANPTDYKIQFESKITKQGTFGEGVTPNMAMPAQSIMAQSSLTGQRSQGGAKFAAKNADNKVQFSSLNTPNLEEISFGRPIWDIGLMPPQEFELRVIVWEVFDCPIDDPEGLTDIFVTCGMSSYKDGLTLKTDTHIRSEGYVRKADAGMFQLEDEVSSEVRRVHDT
jgi:hypothetical protein